MHQLFRAEYGELLHFLDDGPDMADGFHDIAGAGLTPDEIRKGLAVLGGIFSNELERSRSHAAMDPAPAMV